MTDPHPQADSIEEPAAGDSAGAFLRFDAPHAIPRRAPEPHHRQPELSPQDDPAKREADPAASPISSADDIPRGEEELAGLQAEQLFELLRRRERDLDRREAALHARLAAIDHRLRMARLAEAASESSLEPSRAETLGDREAMDRDRGEPADSSPDSSPRAALKAWEPLAREQLRQLEAALKQWEHDQQLARQQHRHRERLQAERRQAWQEEQESRENAVRRKAAELTQREQALERLRQDVFAVHRETLETRLLVEEIWAQVAENGSPEQVERRLVEARRKLADQQHHSERLLLERQEQMRHLAERLQKLGEQLQTEREELRRWAGHLDAEAEAQAARLVAREQELDRRESRLREQQLAWTRQQRIFWESAGRLVPEP